MIARTVTPSSQHSMSYLHTQRPKRNATRVWCALLASLGLTAPAAALEDFVDGFESGLSETAWKRDGDTECRITVSDEVARSGKRAIRFDAGPGSRCEIVPWLGTGLLGSMKREPFERERWYGFSVFIPPEWTPHERNEIIAQWHGSRDVPFGERGRGPPLALRIHREQWWITYGWDEDFKSSPGYRAKWTLWTGPVTPGQWTDWLFRVIWSHDDAGETDVWMNGEMVAQRRGPNTYNDLRGVYLKLGDYHPGVRRTVFIDDVTLTNTRPGGGEDAGAAPGRD